VIRTIVVPAVSQRMVSGDRAALAAHPGRGLRSGSLRRSVPGHRSCRPAMETVESAPGRMGIVAPAGGSGPESVPTAAL